MRESLLYNRAVACNMHNSYTIRLSWYLSFFCFSLSLSFSFAARLSLTPSHSHALQQLIRFINLITVLSSESIMSAYREVSRPSGCASFPSLGNPSHFRLLIQKLRQSLFPFTLFSLLSFSSLSFILSLYRYRC